MSCGPLQLAKSVLTSGALYCVVVHCLSVWFKWLEKKDFFSLSLEVLSRKKSKDFFSSEASALGLATDFSFTVSVCQILSGTHCRLLEIQKTEGNRRLCEALMSVNSALWCVCACVRAHVCISDSWRACRPCTPCMENSLRTFLLFEKLNQCRITVGAGGSVG